MQKRSIKNSGPVALGINWAHDASVSVCSPEGIHFAIAEERISRIKHYYGFPYRSIKVALDYCDLAASDIDYIAFSTKNILFPQHKNFTVIEADGIAKPHNRSFSLKRRIKKIKKKIRRKYESNENKKPATAIHRNWAGFEDRHWSKYASFLIDLGLMDEKIKYYYIAHHRAHAAAAFHLSGLDEACIITVDGKGDGLSATIYKGHDGRMELKRSSKAADSLGSFYQAVTEALGFIPVDGEFKTMGLAALGEDNGDENPFASIINVEDGTFKSKISWTFRGFNAHNPGKEVLNPLGSVSETELFKKILEKLPSEQFAYFAQKHCEQNMLAYTKDAIRITGCDKITASGGVMLNVKANALIRDVLKPSDFFVFPDSTDSGLSTGAAMEALNWEKALNKSVCFYMPYKGIGFSNDEIKSVLNKYDKDHNLTIVEDTTQMLAARLAEGKVIGTFQGRLEIGPRALGNRSVLADPRSEEVKDRINRLLKGREDFVPFAPIILAEDAGKYFKGSSEYFYMTFSVKANQHALETVPAVVHVDQTMRPQIVKKDFNPWLYEVLSDFKRTTGVGVLLNTSFNRHGLPIVGSPEDAMEHLVNGWVDGISIGKWYVEVVQT